MYNLAVLFICNIEVYIIPPMFVLFSDTDSDTSSTTSLSSSSSSAASDEDDYPNRKDNRSFCVKTKDELPFDVSTVSYLLNLFFQYVYLKHFTLVYFWVIVMLQ